MPQQALTAAPAGTAPSVPGWFGKVVMLGDFAHRRVPQAFIATCDPWLSHCVGASRVQLGARWLDTYLTGPLWRFAWAPGVIDAQWWFGVLMPSVDAVGRYFPLLVCRTDQNPPMSATALDSLSAWYAHAGDAALGTLRPGASLDSFEADLAGAPFWPPSQGPQPAGLPPVLPLPAAASRRQHHVLPGQPSPGDWAQALAGPLFSRHYAGHSFWSAPPADDGQAHSASLTVVPGLPEPDQFSLMLEGRW